MSQATTTRISEIGTIGPKTPTFKPFGSFGPPFPQPSFDFDFS
jgi:hypothetical protein